MYALRITGIPASTTALQLSEAMGQDPNSISLTPTTAQKPPSTQTATISFSRENAANRAQQTLRAALPHKTRLGENPNIDLDFHGLTVLSASRNDTVDIVAVHGLNGHSFQTWTSTGSKPRMWLRDFLPRRIPRARIMTYGYNSNVNDKACTTTIHEFAGRLLVDLSALRRHGDEKRPIIFLCHSLGGIVVKEALNRARKEPHHALLATATHGIIFLATPHGGSKTAEFGSILGMAARALGVREDLIQTLRCDSARLKQIQADFRAHYDGCVKIATFVETRKLPGWGGLGIIVDTNSASLGMAGEETCPMDRDHREICKFDNPENGDFQAVCCQIEKMVEGAAANAVTMRVVARALVKVAMFGLNPKIRSIPSWEEARPSSERAKDPKTSGGKTKDPKTSGGRTKDSKTSWRIKEVNPSIEEKKTGSGGRTKGKKTSSGSKKTSDGRSAKRKDPKDGIRA